MAMEFEKIADGDQQSDEAWVINSIVNNANPPPSSTPRIPRVPTMVTDYNKYYVPKVVSIGPYHSRNTNLKFVENLKPEFAKKLLSPNLPNWEIQLTSLYKKLGEPTMVKRLRNFYEEKSTDDFSDKVFTKMMILDGCFILYYIRYIFRGMVESCPYLNSHQIVFIHQDLFLLENQIPFEVLIEVMKLVKFNCRNEIKPFIDGNFLASRKQKPRWFFAGTYRSGIADQSYSTDETKEDFNNFKVDHLLQFLHHSLTSQDFNSIVSNQTTNKNIETKDLHGFTFRNVNELIDVGINFKPSNVKLLTEIRYSKSWWLLFSADVELPPITVDDSTKPMLLNLIAHEMCSDDGHEAWVTSYVCLLDSLIDHPEDVKALRKAGVLDNFLGSDNEVAKVFNEIGTDLVPNIAAYSEAKNKIQNHYESWRNTRLSELKHEYIKSPWAFLALLGAVLALVLSGVQTYYTAWSPKGECDDLCMFLKMNHHL